MSRLHLMRALALSLIGSVLLGGCIVSRVDVDRPGLPLPEALPETAATTPMQDVWWKVFADPALDALMDEALAHNADLVVAAARVLESRAILNTATADRLPTVNLEGNASRAQTSALSNQSPDAGTPATTYTVQGSVAYELDLWGRYARAAQAERARLLATEFDRDAVRLSLTGDVARGYYSLLAAAEQLQRARETLAARDESVGIEQIRFDAGESDESTFRRTQAEAAASRIAVQQFELDVAQRTHALGVLLGRSPQALVTRAIATEGIALPSAPALPAGVPSSVLERRPDIRSADASLVAAAADIGAARAALYPSINLTGAFGWASPELSDLFTTPAEAWNVAGGILQPLFQGGRLRANVQRTEAVRLQRQGEYARTVQNAFRDVLDALRGQELLSGISQTTSAQVDALARAAELSELSYSQGEIAYLDLLDVRRNYYQSQISLVGAQRDALINTVDLALALGGGVPTAE